MADIAKAFFITGISGSGKTTLAENLKKLLPKKQYRVHDFDEKGVPKNASYTWRYKTTDNWLKTAKKYQKANVSMILCGQFVPSEVEKSSEFSKKLNIQWGFLHINSKEIEERLSGKYRSLPPQKVQLFKKWAKTIQKEVENQNKSVKTKDHEVFRTADKTPEQVAQLIVDWIQRQSSK